MSTSYGQILKSSSIIGGSTAINLLIGLLRTKVTAVILGPSGIGIVGLYQSILNLVGAISSLGLNGSGVREVAEAYGTGDTELVGKVVRVLRITCWATGFFGWILAASLSLPLSNWIFGSPAQAVPIAVLGAALLFTSISAGQTALLQGTRRIRDLAIINIASASASTVLSVIIYLWQGVLGILPVLILTALTTMTISWWFARKIHIPVCRALTIQKTWNHAKRLLSLGIALMWSGILSTGSFLLISSHIVREFGLDGNGMYMAAWNLSGLFAGFILSAMGTDFLPRLTAVASDNQEISRLVNEQTEIGMLLALPGIVATLIFAPLIIQLLYSPKFAPAAELLPWFVLGVFGRVVSWPMGFILVAKGAARWYAATETLAAAVHLLFVWLLTHFIGLKGVPIAFFLLYVLFSLSLNLLTRKLYGFRWTSVVTKIVLISSLAAGIAFIVTSTMPSPVALFFGVILAALSGIYSMRGIVVRIGTDHRFVRSLLRIPCMARILNLGELR